MAKKTVSRIKNKSTIRGPQATEDLDNLFHKKRGQVSVVQRAMKDPASLSAEDMLGLQNTIGNQSVARLMAQKIETSRPEPDLEQPYQSKVQLPNPTKLSGDRRPTVQRKLELTGSSKKIRSKFVKKMNENTASLFKLGSGGAIELKNPKAKGREEYSRQMIKAIKDPQTIKLRLVKESDKIFVDSFVSGKVDIADTFKMSPTMFRVTLLHYVVERLATADYEKKKKTATKADFQKAHKKGSEAQEKYLKQLFPGKNTKYKSAGFDNASKKVDAAGNGTIRYVFDHTDVKLIFVQPIVGNVVKENIVKTLVKVTK